MRGRSLLRTARRVVAPVRRSPVRALRDYPRFLRDLRRFRSLGGSASLAALRPELADRTSSHVVDAHYTHLSAWALRRIIERAPHEHVDVGGQTSFVAAVTAVTDVTFVDIRPLGIDVPRLTDRPGDVTALPFDDRSVDSLSCLHVAEHVGLGRYGDPVDPEGTARAAGELARVLAPGGQLLFAVPVGRPRVEFNAHRIHAVSDVLALFAELALEELSVVDDAGRLHEGAAADGWDDQQYACGFFRFSRPRT